MGELLTASLAVFNICTVQETPAASEQQLFQAPVGMQEAYVA